MTKPPDANDLLREHGEDGLRKAIDNAKRKGTTKRPNALPVIMFADLSTISAKSWNVHRLLGAGEVSCWFGPPGSGKSVLAEDIGLHIAAGKAWHGRAVRNGAVLYVALERAAVVGRRALAFGIEYRLTGSKLPFAVLRGPLDFRDIKTAIRIIATMLDLVQGKSEAAALIVIDTVSRALNGGDENSPKDMGALVATLAAIQAAFPSVHVLLTHHVPADNVERMRGHGSLIGAVDAAFRVIKTEAARVAECTKSSDLEDEQRIGFTLRSVIIAQDEHGEPVTAPVVVAELAPAVGTARQRTKIPKSSKVALDALREAIDEVGTVPPASNHIPPNLKTVTLDQWRDYAYRRGVTTSEEPRARQQAFQRAVEKLQDASMVAFWGAQVWAI
jgi:AAA domain